MICPFLVDGGVYFVLNDNTTWVLERIGSDIVFQNNIERKLRYFGHVIRNDTNIEKQLIQGAVEGRRGRGRPITSWTDDIKSWNGGSMNVATNLARDREVWRTLIKTIVLQCPWAPPDLIRERERERALYKETCQSVGLVVIFTYPYTEETAQFRTMWTKSSISQLLHADEASKHFSQTLEYKRDVMFHNYIVLFPQFVWSV